MTAWSWHYDRDRYGALETAGALEAALREIGAERYHILHPFHRLLHTGQLDRGRYRPGR